MRVAAVQMCSGPNLHPNLNSAFGLFRDALARRPELVAFPEYFALMSPNSDAMLAQAQTLQKGIIVETLREWAAEYSTWILAGSVPLKAPKGHPKKITNSSLLIDPDGEIVATYAKMHLFDADLGPGKKYFESKLYVAGKSPVLAQTELGDFGLSICYDLRFPELYRTYAEYEAPILFAPSAFTEHTGRAHWDVLTRARAIENQAYLIAPAQHGENYPGKRTWGHTRIVDPWGRIIAERLKGPGVVWAELKNEIINTVRHEMPCLAHRRLEVRERRAKSTKKS